MPTKKPTKSKAAPKGKAQKGKAAKDKVELPSTPKASEEILPAILRPRKSGFSIMEQPVDWINDAKGCMTAAAGRKKNRPVQFKTISEIRRDMIPVRDFMFQYLLDSYGLAQNTMIDILGAPHVGKTGLVHWLFGGFMLAGSPCYIQNTEGKPYARDWALRFLHPDPRLALVMADRVLTESVYSLTHSMESLERWVNSMRGRESYQGRSVNVPMQIPLVVAIDTWTKLMAPQEEAGRYAYADNLSDKGKKAHREIGEGSNMEHASFAAGMTRVLPNFLEVNNVILILTRHQFEKINMSKGGSHMDAETAAKYNDNSTGGKSFAQGAALQLILGRKGQAKGSGGSVIGDLIWCRCHKNSYGTKDRMIEWTLQNKEFRDRPDHIAQALVFSEFLAQKFTDEKWLSTTADSKRMTCAALGVTAATHEEFSAALHANVPMQLQLGKMLNMTGYIDFVDQIKKQIAEEDKRAAEAAAEMAAAIKEQKAREKVEGTGLPPMAPVPPAPPAPPEPTDATQDSPAVQDPPQP